MAPCSEYYRYVFIGYQHLCLCDLKRQYRCGIPHGALHDSYVLAFVSQHANYNVGNERP